MDKTEDSPKNDIHFFVKLKAWSYYATILFALAAIMSLIALFWPVVFLGEASDDHVSRYLALTIIFIIASFNSLSFFATAHQQIDARNIQTALINSWQLAEGNEAQSARTAVTSDFSEGRSLS